MPRNGLHHPRIMYSSSRPERANERNAVGHPMLAKRPRKREIICLCKKSCGRQNVSQAERVVQFGGLNLDWMKITLKMGMFFRVFCHHFVRGCPDDF